MSPLTSDVSEMLTRDAQWTVRVHLGRSSLHLTLDASLRPVASGELQHPCCGCHPSRSRIYTTPTLKRNHVGGFKNAAVVAQ